MKFSLLHIIFFLISINSAFAQTEHTIMTYNLLNYPFTDTTSRNPYFRTTFSNIQPDILVVQEIVNQASVDSFLSKILNRVSSGYSAGTFINGPDLDRAIFYKNDRFTFISNTPIPTNLRDINEFKLLHSSSGDTLRIFAVHLKANVEDSLARAAEVDSLRKITNALPLNTNYIVAGDFNIYSSNESAYQKLKNQNQPGYFLDPLNLTGMWNNSSYSQYHTQSTRTRAFGDGAIGGLDDRFDMILMSPSIMSEGGITFVPGSYRAYGNDGNHFNDSINSPPNTAVGQIVADALHYSSDHLPVIANFSFTSPHMDLTSIKVIIEGLFNGSTMKPDTITVELRNANAPYQIVDQARVYLNTSGVGSAQFYSATNGIPYYIVVKHRNSVETWSSSPQSFSNGTLSYDFTNSATKAFGNNLKSVNGIWCVYSGDVNQDGFINSQDVNIIHSDNVAGATGYFSSDVTGDAFVEISDLNIVFINSFYGIQKRIP